MYSKAISRRFISQNLKVVLNKGKNINITPHNEEHRPG